MESRRASGALFMVPPGGGAMSDQDRLRAELAEEERTHRATERQLRRERDEAWTAQERAVAALDRAQALLDALESEYPELVAHTRDELVREAASS